MGLKDNNLTSFQIINLVKNYIFSLEPSMQKENLKKILELNEEQTPFIESIVNHLLQNYKHACEKDQFDAHMRFYFLLLTLSTTSCYYISHWLCNRLFEDYNSNQLNFFHTFSSAVTIALGYGFFTPYISSHINYNYERIETKCNALLETLKTSNNLSKNKFYANSQFVV